ncbi:MAG: FtsK/SpoIIIE domain-containing protein, partial [Actinomycetota bacterium]
MELLLSVRHEDDRIDEFVAEVDGEQLVADLVGGGVAPDGLMVARTARRLPPDTTFADSGLLSGDELVALPAESVSADRSLVNSGAAAVGSVALDVVSGPCAGRSFVLAPGRHTVGRGRECDVALGDPTVSRLHLGIEVYAHGAVEVAPVLGASNPSTINDRRLDVATPVEPRDVVTIGGSALMVRPVAVTQPPTATTGWGRIDFHRTPYRPAVLVDPDAPALPSVPTEREVRRFQVLSALAPLLAGLAFFAFSRQPHFLVLTALTPLVMVANTLEDRRSGRRRFDQESERFLAEVADWRRDIDRMLEVERRTRHDAAPDLALLGRRARNRSPELWERGRGAPDFLRLRLGTGSATPRLRPTVPDQGADELRRAAHDALVGTERLRGVPVTVPLVEHGVVGVHGSPDLVDGLAASLVVQSACLHSPDDLVIVAATHPMRSLGWCCWLPHTRSITSPLAGSHLVTDRSAGDDLVRRLVTVAEGRGHEVRFPRIVAVLDERLGLDPADGARLLDIGPPAGIDVIWCADDRAGVPRQATSVLSVRHAPGAAVEGELWTTDGTAPIRHVDVEVLAASTATALARALAPVRDASTSSPATAIPRVAPLLDVVGGRSADPDQLAERWRADSEPSRRTLDLSFPIGLGVDGPVSIDLVADGPHALIGGTSGAGKSELVQAMVASLAARHSPQRLHFLFVDYKGGASSNVFGRLPHTVGYVTNLSADLAHRALVSLRAEVDRRMRLLEGRAKDLEEMLAIAPDEAPASLVIVVDEFATLVKEIPDFVAGIVDIAQRGRSLGVHLVLATQRPSGSINENILANTNIRIALRTLSNAESASVIDAPDAADIPSPLRGRGYVRLGPRQLVAFQSSFGGAAVQGDDDAALARRPIRTRSLRSALPGERSDDEHQHLPSPARTRTQLDVVVDAIATAARRLDLPPARRPWRDVLPDSIALDDVLADPRSAAGPDAPGRVIAVGTIDDPAHQDQRPAVVDLEADGGWLVYGSGGSGKTTALQTLALSAVRSVPSSCSDRILDIVVFDLASRGLASLAGSPTVSSIAFGDDPEAITRQLAALHDELERRRRARGGPDGSQCRILVIVDGIAGLTAALTGPSGSSMGLAVTPEAWLAMFEALVVDGRQYGIHVAIGADRRASVPTRIAAAISNRLVLRHADDAG